MQKRKHSTPCKHNGERHWEAGHSEYITSRNRVMHKLTEIGLPQVAEEIGKFWV